MPSSFPRAQELRHFFQERLSNLVEAVQNTVHRNPIRYVPKEIVCISENIARFGKPVVVEKHAIQENDTKEWQIPYYFDFRTGEFYFSEQLLHRWHLFSEDRIPNRDSPLKNAMADHFLLHEMIHIENDLTSYKYHDTDDAPSVATAVDYDADACAILAAIHLWPLPPTQDPADSWKPVLQMRIQAALMSMEIFTDLYAGKQPEIFSEQIFLRYFLWHLQYARAVDWANKSASIADFRIRAYPVIDMPEITANRKPQGAWIQQSFFEKTGLRIFITLIENDRSRKIIRFNSADSLVGKSIFEGIKLRNPNTSRLGFAQLFQTGEGAELIGMLNDQKPIKSPVRSEWMYEETHSWASSVTKESLSALNRKTLLAIDDCVIIYRSKDDTFLRPDAKSFLTNSSIKSSTLENPNTEELICVLPNYNSEIEEYLKQQIYDSREEPKGATYEAKVGLRGVTLPVEGVQEMVFSIDPLSYWIINAFNRRILKVKADDPLKALRKDALARFLRIRDNNEWTVDFPSALYVEVALITADSMFVLLQKNPSTSIYAASGGSWSCGIEEGLRLEQHIQSDRILFQAALFDGLYRELKILDRDIMSARFNSVAIEMPNLNTAVMGYVRLNINFTELKRRISQSSDFLHHVESISVDRVRSDLFTTPNLTRKWHPTARARIHLAMQDFFELVNE